MPQPVPDPPQSQEHSEEVSKREAEAALIAEEEAELRKLQTKKDIGSKLTKKQQDRYKFLTENAKTREEAAAAAAADFKADEQPHTETGHAVDPLLDGGSFVANSVGGDADAADAEKDEKARLIQEEEDEMFILKSKKKLKKSEKERLRVLEEHADQRAREAEEATATQELDQTITEVIDSADATVEDLAPEADGTAQAEADGTAQAEADERAKMIQAEEEELAQLHAKKKPKKGDRDRIRILEERVEERAREAEAATAAAEQFIQESSGDTTDFKTDETAPISVDDHLVDDNAAQAEQDEAARIIEDEEAELELLLMKSKLKKAEKARLKELQDNKERREQEAAAKAEADAFPNSNVDAGDVPPTEDVAADEGLVESVAPNNDETELAAKIIDEEEMELDILLAKSKLKKSEKTRLKELQDRKELREQEAAAKAEAAAKDGAAADVPFEETPVGNAPSPEAGPVDEAALQKEAEDAIVAAEDSELSELLAKSKLKKSERSRLKELQDRKDKRDEEVRVAAAKAEEEEQMAREKAEQEARELDEQKKREEEEKRAAEIAAEQAEISTLKAKKKLKRSEKDRLAELEFRRDERASAEAAQLAEELLKEDAANDADTKNDPEPLSWADDDPAQDNGANDDWLGWGLSSSKKSKKTKGEAVPDPPATDLEPQSKPEEDDTWSAWGTSKKDKKKKGKSSNLIDFGGADDTPVVLDPVNPVPEATGFDFGWGKPSKIVEPVVDDIWSFGGSSKKKKSKDAPVEVLEDTNAIKAIDEGESKGAGDDFWPTFGAGKSLKDKKSSSKDDLVAISPPQAPTPPYTDLTETGDGDGTIAWDDPSGSTELTKTKSLVSDKDSKKSSTSKEPKLSKKELEKLEKEKKKAEKEQKAREEQEAKEAAERARIEEEERLAAEAKAEEERLAQEEADRIRRVEEENQAALDAIAQEEADLTALQSKKDAGRKLTKKEKEKFDKLSASCQARADEKAAQEAAEQAAREEAERLQREAEEQARKAAIEKEEAELKDLQKKKDSGRKLLRKDKDRYELLTANKKARKQAEKEAEAAKEDPAPADEPKLDDDLEKDLAGLDANELDELDKFLSVPAKPVVKKAADVDPFSFWGASKKTTISSKKGQSSVAEPVSIYNPQQPLPTSQSFQSPHHQRLCWRSSQSASAEIAHAESSSSSKLLEATTSVSVDTTAHNDVAAAVAWPGWKDTFSSTPSEPAIEPCRESQNDEIETSVRAASPPAAEPMKRKSAFGGKIADRLKTFEAPKDESVPPPPPPVPANLIPPPPPPAAVAPIEAVKTKKKSKKTTEIPGSFPTEEDEHPDDIIEVIDMSPAKSKKSSSKKSSKAKSEDTPIPIPPPPPAVPDAPTSPPEGKKERKKERPKINRDGGSSWGMWTASTPREKEKKSSSKSKAAEEPRKESKSRSPEKEENLSSKGSSSDKAERADKKEKAKEKHALPKVTSVFASTPPISRSISTREKRHKEGKSSRRTSIDVNNGMISPPPEEMPEINSKAAKILGIGEGMGIDRSISSRKKSSRPIEDDDIVMVGANDAGPSPEKSSRRRPSKVSSSKSIKSIMMLHADNVLKQSYARDDDIVMVDAADATPTPGLRRSNTTGSARKGLGSLFGGILSTPRTEARRRNTYHTDGEDAGAATEADVEAVKAARRARRVEREVTERSKSETRREKRRRQEEAAEAQRQAEKEARRVERRAARAREEEERRTTEEKDAAREERRRQKRAEREKEREALEIGGEDADAEARRAARRERRKARTGESDLENDEDRRRRRAERRAARDAEGKSLPRRRTEPVEDDFVYPRPERISRRHTDDMERGSRESAAEAPTWPHSGLSSWVKDHSDAGPPPEDGGMTTEAVDDENGGDEDAARRERRRRRRYGDTDVEGSGDRERRRKRREERSDGSDERRRERKGSLFVDGPGARGSGGIGGFWKKLTRN